MYVRKDFGDKVWRGSRQVFVYARMAEVKREGTEDARQLESDVDTAAEIPFQLLDFLSPDNMVMEFSMKKQNLPFEIELDYSGGDQGRLLIRRSGSAEKSKELMPGFMGTLPTNRVGIGVAVWDETATRLRMIPPSELAVWVSLYYVHRVTHHYYYHLDENNQRNLYEVAKSAGWDLTVKATLELFLTEYLSKSPQSAQVFGKDMTKLKDIAEHDTTSFKQSRDQTIDHIKENLPRKIDEFSGALLNYIEELRAGTQIVF